MTMKELTSCSSEVPSHRLAVPMSVETKAMCPPLVRTGEVSEFHQLARDFRNPSLLLVRLQLCRRQHQRPKQLLPRQQQNQKPKSLQLLLSPLRRAPHREPDAVQRDEPQQRQ